jgi:protein-disulfide isomerase
MRNFPLHGNSVLAATAAEAAGEQGKFWEMHNLLFENQQTWGEKQTPQTELFTQYAQTLGLDMTKFSAVLKSNSYAAKIQRDKSDGMALGIKGTPTFFVNGKMVRGVPQYEELKAIIEEELKATTP